MLDLTSGWQRCWTVTWCSPCGSVTRTVEQLRREGLAGAGPVRRFSWRRDQRHRPGLKFLISTGRLHGFESLAESDLLLALDFAGEVLEVLPQPLRLTFGTVVGQREHTPDFLVRSTGGVWLIDVRPAALLGEPEETAFAAAAELALACGWGFAVAAGWRGHVRTTLDWLSSRRRPLSDPLGVEAGLMEAAATPGRTLRQLAAASTCPPVARAHLLHLLWQRRLGVDLMKPLGDQSVIVPGREALP
ncbi:TnsA-like heteromeric transposase endonuclease subunit [Streptomyces sp. NPDC046939]|uniref:TnsA-like heteromeric transposase endonuclease subunit n=1 Tax=Streptomyces sp. NPDC046939 TaxID=3155376 RepID=UPI0033D441B3